MATTRRNFIRMGCCAAAGLTVSSGLSPFGLLNALAQGSGYKAMVCVFLFGGNDGNNVVVPLDTAVPAGFRYTDYLAIRGAQTDGGLGLTQAELLPVTARTAQPSGSHLSAARARSPGRWTRRKSRSCASWERSSGDGWLATR